MMRRTLLLALLSILCRTAVAAQKPNIISIEVDDLLYTYTSVWGSKTSPTPTVERLAKAGFVFDQAMCQGMMCGPSRNSLICGRYSHQLGFYQNGDLKKLPSKLAASPRRRAAQACRSRRFSKAARSRVPTSSARSRTGS